MDDMVTGSRVAVIPARGGSKRIPRKNIMPFHGKPMIAWTIDAALESGLFDRVLVSTDDPEIAEVAARHGAPVPFLRDGFADDQSPVSLATLASLDQLERECGESYAVVAQLMANCPIRSAADIRDAVAHFDLAGAPSQISCFKFGWMNPWWASKLSEGGHPQMLFPEALAVRSQDLPSLYCPTGAIWVADVLQLRQGNTFHLPGRVFCELSWESAVDIDDTDDFRMAEAIYLLQRARREPADRLPG
jgi:CMP-N-acetylneuraminic acid synthetase